jgi:hypothetical protein
MKNPVFWDVTQCCSWEIVVSKERIASIIRVENISHLGTTLAVTSNWCMQRSSVASYCFVSSPPILNPDDGGDTFLRNNSSRATRRNIPDFIFSVIQISLAFLKPPIQWQTLHSLKVNHSTPLISVQCRSYRCEGSNSDNHNLSPYTSLSLNRGAITFP